MTDLDKGLRQRLAEGQHAEAAQIGRGDGLPDREAEQALRDGTREPRSLRERIAVALHHQANLLGRGEKR